MENSSISAIFVYGPRKFLERFGAVHSGADAELDRLDSGGAGFLEDLAHLDIINRDIQPTDTGGPRVATIKKQELDIRFRIGEIKSLQPGWLDGKGVALSKTGLDWLADSFEKYYPDDVRLPYLSPTPEGHVLAEWRPSRSWSTSLEIDLNQQHGEWHALNLDNDQEETIEFDLSKAAGWERLVKELRMMVEEVV